VVPRYAGIAQDHDPALCDLALDHDPALCGIARDHDPALRGIAQDQNDKARDAGSIDQTWAMLYDLKEQSIKNSFIGDFPNTKNHKIKFKKRGYLMRNFGPALCGIARDQTLQANISANSKHNLKIF
jgi:hypothetical protein